MSHYCLARKHMTPCMQISCKKLTRTAVQLWLCWLHIRQPCSRFQAASLPSSYWCRRSNPCHMRPVSNRLCDLSQRLMQRKLLAPAHLRADSDWQSPPSWCDVKWICLRCLSHCSVQESRTHIYATRQ